MKKLLGLLFSCSLYATTRAQTWEEWFRQNSTRIKYLQIQAAALQAYMAVEEDGYKLVEDALSDIGGINQEEFDLHKDHFASLDETHDIGDMPELDQVRALRAIIIDRSAEALKDFSSDPTLTANELKYIAGVLDKLTTMSEKEFDEFYDLVHDGRLKMTDGERIQGIRAVEDNLRDQYRFLRIFIANINLLIIDRQREMLDLGDRLRYFGNPN